MIIIYLKGLKKHKRLRHMQKHTNGRRYFKLNESQYVQKCKPSRHLGKSGRHLGFSNVHLFGFEECFKNKFCTTYPVSAAIINYLDK